MEQKFNSNSKYLIKTINGWEEFQGVVKNVNSNKETYHIETLSGRKIHCTTDHRFIIDGNKVPAHDLKVGDFIETENSKDKIKSITKDFLQDTYDIFESESNTILANGINVSQCDELAFVRKRIAKEFWTSIFPTLSCLVSGTIILTDRGFERIEEYFHNRQVGEYFKLEGLKLWSFEGFDEVSHGYVSPGSETVVVSLSNGQRVEVTPEHPLYCKRSQEAMIQARDLMVGDRLMIHKGMMIGYEDGKKLSLSEFLNYTNGRVKDLLLNVDYKSFSDIVDYFGEVICCNDYEELNIFVQMLNNYGYEYHVDGLVIKVYRQVSEFRSEWIKIESIEHGHVELSYDFTVPKTHAFLQNGIMGSNTGGRCIITSTPTDDETLFANIWKLANKTIDEFGNETDIGINGFKALKVDWTEHPERDEDYKRDMINQFGEEKFRREFELEFIGEHETLIDPIFLAKLKHSEPTMKSEGEIRWYKELSSDRIYLIGYDPSLGTGGDFAAITMFEFPSMEQVGEWMHNKSDIPQQLKILRRILNTFKEAGLEEDQVRWTVENNTVGEAPLVLIDEYGEDKFYGYFMSEPYNPTVRTRNRRFRKGYNTNATSKLSACSRFKGWIENEKMTIHSRPFIIQLKSFVSRGRTYAAISGEHDDLVSSALLVVRMATETMKEEDDYMEELGVNIDDEDDYVPPLPVY